MDCHSYGWHPRMSIRILLMLKFTHGMDSYQQDQSVKVYVCQNFEYILYIFMNEISLKVLKIFNLYHKIEDS